MNQRFIPAKPQPLPARSSLWQKLSVGLRSGLSLFLGGSYTDVGVGRHRVPTLPWFRSSGLGENGSVATGRSARRCAGSASRSPSPATAATTPSGVLRSR